MTILQALADPNLFGALPAFRDLSTWRAWCVFLAATYGLPLADLATMGLSEADALALYCQHTGRTTYDPPAGGFREAVAIVGRQAGKDRIASVIQAYEAITATPEADGTSLYALSICQDARAALRTQFAYVRAPFRKVPLLAPLVIKARAETVTLTTGVTLAAYPCRPHAIRGLRARVVICSELAFFRSRDGFPTDIELLRAVRPLLATTDGRLVILSSPYAADGALFDLHARNFGRDESPVLVWQATAPEMNPTLSAGYLASMATDPAAYASEVGAEFRTDVSALLTPEALAECVMTGVHEREPEPGVRYTSFADVASGSGKDAFAVAIAHRDGSRGVLDAVRAWEPPFNPHDVMGEAAALLARYRLHETTGDRFAGGFVVDGFLGHGVTYRLSERDRSALYVDLVPLVNADRVRVLDDAALLKELRGLDRRRGTTGRDRVDHRPGAHDDRANAAAGALTLAARVTHSLPASTWLSIGDDEEHDEAVSVY